MYSDSHAHQSTGYLAPNDKYVRSFSPVVFWTVSGDETRQRVKYADERVCKSHLLNCCPHDILSGTVSGLKSALTTNTMTPTDGLQVIVNHLTSSVLDSCLLVFGGSAWTWGSARRSTTWRYGQIMKSLPRTKTCSLSLM